MRDIQKQMLGFAEELLQTDLTAYPLLFNLPTRLAYLSPR